MRGWRLATPLWATRRGGPQVTVIGTPSPFAGAMTFAGNWLFDTFNNPLSYSGHEGNFQAYVNTLTIAPGKSKSLLHFVVLGQRVTAATSAGVRAAVEATATSLATAPEISDLTTAELCSIDNFNIASMTISGFNYASCSSRGTRRSIGPPAATGATRNRTQDQRSAERGREDDRPAARRHGVRRHDLEEITRAYLDRIEFYDQGQFGFHAYEIVATDAMAQAKAADAARKKGKKGPLLGIPIAIKNLYDTLDMPTTNGSFTFEGFRPAHDAFQVARLREAGR